MSEGKKRKQNVASICFDCKNALGGCSWSRSFKPVPGWTAEPTTLVCGGSKPTESFRVTACPKFDPDGKTPAPPKSIPVRCVETGVEFKSISEAAKSVGGHNGALREMFQRGRSYAYGYHWELLEKEAAPC